MAAPQQPSAPVQQQQPSGTPVIVNVYTLMSKETAATRVPNDMLDVFGMSIYHAGVEVFGREYSFGMDPSGRPDPTIDGVFVVPPRKAVGDFKEAITVGHMPANFTPQALEGVVRQMRQTWKAVTYHILERNCTHFAREMVVTLDASFKPNFPDYVCRVANVGNKVLPDALVSRVTEMVAPPPAIPPKLVNVVDIAWSQPKPTPRPAPAAPSQQAPPAQPPAAKPASAGGLFKSAGMAVLSVGRMAASAVGGVVGSLVSEGDRRAYESKFPECNSANLRKCYTCSVNYCFREFPADVFIATDCVCLTGPPSLHLVIPMSDIEAVHPARFAPPPAPRLPPTFEIANGNANENPALFIFRKSRPGAVTPLFSVRTLTSGVTEKVSAVAGVQGNTLTADAMELIEGLWHAARTGAPR